MNSKNRFLNTALCLALAIAMTFAPIMSSFAITESAATDETPAVAESIIDADAETPADGEDQPAVDPSGDDKEVADDEAKPEEKAAPEEEPAAAPEKAEPAPEKDKEEADETQAEPASEPEEQKEESEPADTKTKYVWKDGKVKVTAVLEDASAIPDDAEFVVKAINKDSKDYNYKTYLEALNKGSDSTYDESNTLLYDIAFIKDGVELQPAKGKVKVTFEFLDSQLSESLGAGSAADVNVTHLPLKDKVKDKYDTTADAKNIDAGDIKVEEVTKSGNKLAVSIENEKVQFETSDFSVYAYTVDFEYNGYSFSIPGEGSIKLSEIFSKLHIDKDVSDVETVTFSNTELVEVSKTDGDWELTSKKAFSTEETLTVKMSNGDTIVITVTDAQSYPVTVNFYDYDGNTPVSYGGSQNLYLYVEITDADGNKHWAYRQLNAAGSSGSITETFDTFLSESNNYGYYEPNPFTYNSETCTVDLVRIYTEQPNYHLVSEDLLGYEHRPNDSIEGYEFLGTTYDSNQANINIRKSFEKEYNVRLHFDESASFTDSDGYYVLVTVEHQNSGNTYFFQQITGSTNSDNNIDIKATQWVDQNNTPQPNEKFTGNEKNLTIRIVQGSNLRLNDVTYNTSHDVVEGGIVKAFNVSYPKTKEEPDRISVEDDQIQKTEVYDVVNFSKADAYEVTVNIYDYDGEQGGQYASQDARAAAFTDNYYVRAYLKSGDEIVGWTVVPITLNGSEDPVTVSVAEFYQYAESQGNTPVGQLNKIPYTENENYTVETRLIHTSGSINTYNDAANADDTAPDGFEFKAGVTESDHAVINLKQAYEKEFNIRLNFDTNDVDFSTLENYYVVLEVPHQSTGTAFYVIDIAQYASSAVVSGDTITVDIPVSNTGWFSSNNADRTEKFTGNETVNMRLVKASSSGTGRQELIKTDASNVTVLQTGSYVQGYTATYDNETTKSDWQKVDDDQTQKTEYYLPIDFTSVNATNDYTFKSILGPNLTYGIVADHLYHQNHLQTNFAVNHYTGAGIDTRPDLSGTSSGAIVIAEYNENDHNAPGHVGPVATSGDAGKLFVGNPLRGTLIAYVDQNSGDTTEKVRGNLAQTEVIETPGTQLSANIVEPAINYGERISNELIAKPATFDPVIPSSGKLTIDTTHFDDDATIYIDADRIVNYLSEGNLIIKKKDNQTIVFNFDETYTKEDNLTIGQFVVQEPYVTEMLGVDSFSTQTPEAKDTNENKVMDQIARHIVWNCNKCDYVKIDNSTGIFLMPVDNSETEIGTTSGGWIVSDGYVHNSTGEWHNFYADMPDTDKVTLHAYKTINGKTPTTDQKFTFTLEWYQYNEETGEYEWTSVDTINNTGGSIEFAELSHFSEGWNIYRIKESTEVPAATPGSYTVSTVTYYAAVKCETRNPGQTNQFTIISYPEYYTTFSEDAYQPTIIDSETQQPAVNYELTGVSGNNVPTPTFDNDENKGSLTVKKFVKGDVDPNKKYHFTVKNERGQYLKEDGTTSATIYQIEISGGQTITISDIPVGTYTVTEDVLDAEVEGFVLQARGSGDVEVVKNGTASVTLTNDYGEEEEESGSLKITKSVTVNGQSSSDNGSIVNGAYKFKIMPFENGIAVDEDATDIDGNVVSPVTINVTNGTGKSVEIDNLAPGTYRIREIEIPDGMSLVEPASSVGYVDVVVEADNTTNVPVAEFVNNAQTSTDREDNEITINKQDKDGSSLDGATFKLYDGDDVVASYSGSSFTISTSDSNLASYLPSVGAEKILTLKEETAPQGYEKDDTAYEVKLTATSSTALKEGVYVTTITYGITIGGKTSANIINTRKTGEATEHDSVTITKKDQDGGALSGAEFKLYEEESCDTVVGSYTGGNITISTEDEALADYLPSGNNGTVTLYLKETKAPAGYSMDTVVHPVVITTTIAEAYDATEDKYITTTTYTMTIDGKSDIDVTNNKKEGETTEHDSVTITKKDQDGGALSGAEFKLYGEETCETVVDNYTGGSFVISTEDAELADYLPSENNGTVTLYLKETKAPAGYSMDTAVHPVVITTTIATAYDETQDKYITTTTYTMTIDGNSEIDITNNKKTDTDREDNEITINKQDQDGSSLDGATFTLYDGETEVATYEGGTFKIKTDDSNLVGHLPAVGQSKTLTLKETAAPEGYAADTTEYSVVVTASSREELVDDVFVTITTYDIKINGSTSADITNNKRTDSDRKDSEITINKQDQAGSPLSGATFTLYDGNDVVATYEGGTFKINTADTALVGCLPAIGEETTLILRETAAPEGYEQDNTAYPVKISASAKEELKNGVFVTTTTYTITIDGKTSADITNTKKTGSDREDAQITINKQDQDKKALDGATFKLYDGETEVASYTGGSFTIKTDDAALAAYLPAAGGEKTLLLKEESAPAGYEPDTTEYQVKLTATSREELRDGVFVTITTYGITINGETSADVTNTKKTGSDREDNQITINKQDQAGTLLNGATFTLYDGANEVTTYSGGSFTIKTDDEVLASYLPAAGSSKELKLKETEAPAGYEADNTEYPVVITAASREELRDGTYVTITTYSITINGETSADITNNKKTDSDREDSEITINKQDQAGSALDGATFKLYDGANEVATYTGGSFKIKTKDAALAEYLPAAGAEKTLILKETEAPVGYDKDTNEYEVKLTATSREELIDDVFVTITTYVIKIEGSTSADITNNKKTASDREDDQITINKQDQDEKALEGATFKLYDGETEVASYTGGSFTIKTDDEVLASYLPAAGDEKELTLKETAAPAGYDMDEIAYTVKLTATSREELRDGVFVTITTYGITINGETSADVTNTKKTGSDREDNQITINKQDQAGTLLNGATFTLYDGANEVTTYTGGSFTIKTDDTALASYLPAAGSNKELTLKETAAPAGYEKDGTAYTVKLTATSREELRDGTFVTITTYGITINGETSADITNTKKTGSDREDSEITINKQDQEGTILNGATFKLYDGENPVATYIGGTFKIKTDDSDLSECLPEPGDEKTLTLKETIAPSGYDKDETAYTVKLTATSREELIDDVFVTITTYTITIDGKTSADITNTKKTDTDRVDNEITINKQDQAGSSLSGATFKLYDGETEVASYTGGSFMIKTDDTALAAYLPAAGSDKELTLKEESAPAGYEKDDTEYTVKITASAKEELKDGVFVTTTTYDITINGETSADVTNTKKTGSDREDNQITINKQDQAGTLLNGATFTLYDGANEVTTYTGGSFTIKTDDDALCDYLPAAGGEKELTLKETAAPAGYDMDETAYTVKLTATSREELIDGTYVTITTYGITINGKTSADITNNKKTGSDREDDEITVNKQDQDGSALNGATFKLYDGEEDVATYTGGSFTIKTDDKDLADCLPAAGSKKTLTLKETAAPDGYAKDETEYSVEITASSREELINGTYVTITTYTITINGETSADITNTKKTGTDRVDDEITINKQDQDGEALSGATFKLYDGETEVASYTGGSFKIKTDDEALCDYLPEAGAEKILTLKETEAPDGYAKDETSYTVRITASSSEALKDGVFVTTTTYSITINGKTSADITNTKKTGTDRKDAEITINKQDQDGSALNGATFKLYDGETEVASYTGGSFTISTDDSALADYLPAAGSEKELTLKEVSAPGGYEKDDTEYTVTLTASAAEALKDGVFVTTTTYGITIDGETSADITNTKKTGEDREDSQITINKQDQDGSALQGATFKLYDGDEEVATYTGGSFTIKTDDEALSDSLPEAGSEKTLTLKETEAPDGYAKDETEYAVKIKAVSSEALTDDVFVTTTTYTITINGKTSADITNTKKTGEDRADAGITINKIDQDGETVQGATFRLFDGKKKVAEYKGGSFEIRTDDDALADFLPEPGEEKILTLKETGAPEGYTKDDTEYTVRITADAEEELKDGVFITTTTYSITINNESELDVTNIYSASGIGEIKVQKVLEGRKWTNNDKFTFTISAADGTPMPANKSITITKSDKNQTKSFGEIKFTKAGTYTYKVKETKGSIGGVTYDTTEHTVTIEAVDDGKGNIVAKAGSALVQTVEFVNTYEAGLTKGEIKVQKILEGRKWTDDDEFEFTLSAPAGTPMPEEDTITITKDDKDQTVSFGQIVFDEPGKYTYTVKETKGDIKGVTYDTKKHKVTIEVVDDGKGNLVAKDGTKLIQTVKITNTAHKGVKTGDDSNVILYSTTMLGSILAFLFMAIRRRRNRA